MIPLEFVNLYSLNGHLNKYWNLERNLTAWNLDIKEFTTTGNALSALMLRALAPTLPGAHIGTSRSLPPLLCVIAFPATHASAALFDSHALFTDMFNNPSRYLNGTVPPNVTGSIAACEFELHGGPVGGSCPLPVLGPAQDSFLWFDELHPSQQADRVVARELASAVRGNTRWATWIS